MVVSQAAVGMIGLGLMGAALSERLLRAGYPVLGYDLSAERRTELRRLGGTPCETAGQVFQQAERCLFSLPNSEVVAALLQEVGPELRSGQLILDTTTGDPRQTADVGEKLGARNIAYVDATVSGSSEQTRQGDVIVMLGGSREGVERARDLLSCFAKNSFHLGSWGAGAQMKLITNLVLGLNRAALAEGLSLARETGLNMEQTLEVLKAGMSYSRIMETKGEKMRLREYAPQGKLAQHLKDVELIRGEAQRYGMPVPFSDLHAEILRTLVSRGMGELDNSAIQEYFQRPDPQA